MKIQDDVLAGLIDINSKVLDVGCGDGNLLLYLKRNKRIDGRGLEINQKNVQECLAKGLAVVEGDAECCRRCQLNVGGCEGVGAA